MEYKVTLPDHDYVIAPQHKLIPSVIGDMRILENDFSGDAVTYSSPMYCGIRSAKHSGLSAYHHLQDMKHIRSLDIFNESFNNDAGESKPVMIVTVDGGPDKNQRYTKTIKCGTNCFITQGLDAFFLATKAPERSAFIRVEQRMVKFSQEMSGLVLPHDEFGSYLNSKGETVDSELENKYFIHEGEVLAEVLSGMMIDRHPVLAEYFDDEADQEIPKKSQEWKSIHVCESQYFLQIVKCKDRNCFQPFHSSYLKIVNDRFLPFPIAVIRSAAWLKRDVNAHYLSLLQNLAYQAQLGVVTLRSFPKGIPYDYS